MAAWYEQVRMEICVVQFVCVHLMFQLHLAHVCVFVNKKCLSVLHIASSICSHPPKFIYHSKRFSYRTQLLVAVRIITCVHTLNFMPWLLVWGRHRVLLLPAKFEFCLDLLSKYMYQHPIS